MTETGDRERGDASLHRVWLGERFDARSDAVVPARGWTYDASRRGEAGGAGGASRAKDELSSHTRPATGETFGREERVGADVDQSSAHEFAADDEDYEDARDAEARVAAPQHGGGFGGFRPGGAARDPRDSIPRLTNEGRASRLYALWGAGTLFVTALAFATYPRRGLAGWGRVLEGRRDSRAREEPRRAGVEMT